MRSIHRKFLRDIVFLDSDWIYLTIPIINVFIERYSERVINTF